MKGSSAERRRQRNSLPIQRLQKPWAALSGPLACTGSSSHCATALLERSSLQLPPTELGCVPALPLSESPPLPTHSHSYTYMYYLLSGPGAPTAFSLFSGHSSSCPLAALIRTDSKNIALRGPEASDWHRGTQLPFLHLGHKPCTKEVIKPLLGQPNFVMCPLAGLTPPSMLARRCLFSCFT